MTVPAFGQPFRPFDFFWPDGMCPWCAESESSGGFLSGELGRRFNHRAQRIAHQAGVFPVRVVDAPELVASRYSRSRAHTVSSAQGASEWM
jgi:hypothetical protein